MKKPLALLLVLLFMTAMITACGEKANTGADSELPAEEEEELALDGYNLSICQYLPESQPMLYKEKTLYAELALKRIAEIDKKYGTTTSFVVSTNDPFLENTIPKIIAGQYMAEVAYNSFQAPLTYAEALIPLTEVKDIIDYEDSEKYGSAGMLEISMVNSVPYAVYPIQWPEKLQSTCYGVICVNENLIKDNNLTDPREYVENGTWKWDKLFEVLPLYTVDNGDGNVVKAFGYTWNMLEAFAISNGMTFVSDENGTTVPGIKTKAFAEAVDAYYKLTNEYKDTLMPKFSSYENSVASYINNEMVMYQSSFAHMYMDIIFNADNFGVIPFPCGPSQEYGVWPSIMSGLEGMGIYANAESPEYAAEYISLLFEPLEGYETKEERAEALKNTFYAQSDIDFYLKHLDNSYFDYWTSGMTDVFVSMAEKAKKGATAAEIVSSFEGSYSSVIDKYASGNFEYMNSHK